MNWLEKLVLLATFSVFTIIGIGAWLIQGQSKADRQQAGAGSSVVHAKREFDVRNVQCSNPAFLSLLSVPVVAAPPLSRLSGDRNDLDGTCQMYIQVGFFFTMAGADVSL